MVDVKTLSAEEKLTLVMGRDSWRISDLGGKIESFRVSDGPVGLRTVIDPDDEGKGYAKSIAYPSAQVLSHTWDTDMARKYGEAIGCDCADAGVDIILGPAVNIKRTPLCGRNFEYFSEDPILAGYMAKAYVEGVQSMHVGTCVKHYCCNNAEYARLFASSEVDERTLREIYLRQFEIAMRAKPWSVMCSYNLVCGTLMSENAELFRVLREELGFDGLIMSDWCAVRRTARSINAGLDLEMPYYEIREKQFREDYASGLVDGEALDKSAGRVLSLAEKCAAERKKRTAALTRAERDALALDAAREGIVLLKNDGVLPLTDETLVVTGAPERAYYTGGGSARVDPIKDYKRLSAALREHGFDAVYRETVRENVGGTVCLNGSVPSCREELTSRDAVIIEVGESCTTETESRDRQTIKLAAEEVDVIKYLAAVGKKTVVVVYAGSAVDMSDWAGLVDAIIYAGYAGQNGNDAVADIISGAVNPSGKLTETFPCALSDVPAVNSRRDPENVYYDEGLMVGYRYFATANAPVLYPFGYGLSYSEFEYSGLEIENGEETLVARFDITNKSDIGGKEVAQLYVGGFAEGENRPVRELKGFAKVFVAPHETKRVTIEVPKKDLMYFDGGWKNAKRGFEVQIGKSSLDIVMKKTVI